LEKGAGINHRAMREASKTSGGKNLSPEKREQVAVRIVDHAADKGSVRRHQIIMAMTGSEGKVASEERDSSLLSSSGLLRLKDSSRRKKEGKQVATREDGARESEGHQAR